MEGEKQAKESVDGGGERHGDAVRRGETVGSDGGTQSAREKDAGMRDEEKRHPENRGADGEMVVEVAGGSSKVGLGLVIFVDARPAEAFVGMPIVFGEIETVLDQRSASKSIIADAVPTHPGVEKRQRKKKKKKEQALRFARAAKRRWAEVFLVHERGIRRKLLLSPAAIITGQQHDVEPISQDRGRDLVTANNRDDIVAHDSPSALGIRELKRGARDPAL